LRWFKHYANASTSIKLNKIIDELGIEGYGRYFLLLELLSEKFDGESTTCELHYSEISAKVRIKFSKKLATFLQKLHDFHLITFEIQGKVYKINCPILLDLQSKDFKFSTAQRRKARPQTDSKNKNKIKTKNKIKNNTTENEFSGSETWDSYSKAYLNRYGAKPVRNASVNSKILQFVKRLGAIDSPHVAAFYVEHDNNFYVAKMHPVGLLLADAEKLHTEFKTGNKLTPSKLKGMQKKNQYVDQLDRVTKGEL